MKKIFIPVLLFSFLLFGACGGDTHDGFEISGRFDNSNQQKVYLNQAMGNRLIAVDSTTLKQDGSFAFKGTNSNTRFYIVSVVSEDKKVTNNLQLLVGAKEKVQLTGDLSKDLKVTYNVTGSKDSETIKLLNDRLRATSKTLDSIASVYRNGMNTNRVDSAKKAELDLLNQKTYQDHRKFSKGIIEDNDSSLVSIMALFQHLGRHETVFNIQNDFSLYSNVLKNLGSLYPESELVKSLRMMVTTQRRRKTREHADRLAIGVGSIAPEILLPTPKGEEIALSSLRGKYVLLDFWAGWCGPCRRENPNLVDNYKKYRRKGFKIYQVSLDKDKEEWTDAIKKDRLTWYHVSDLKHWKSDAAKLYNVRSIPSNFLIDPEGKIVATNLRGENLGKKLKEIYSF